MDSYWAAPDAALRDDTVDAERDTRALGDPDRHRLHPDLLPPACGAVEPSHVGTSSVTPTDRYGRRPPRQSMCSLLVIGPFATCR